MDGGNGNGFQGRQPVETPQVSTTRWGRGDVRRGAAAAGGGGARGRQEKAGGGVTRQPPSGPARRRTRPGRGRSLLVVPRLARLIPREAPPGVGKVVRH